MSIFQKIKQLFSTALKTDKTVNVSSVPAPTSNDIDKYRFPTIESILNVNTSIPNIDYILQRKATQFKKEGKMDFAIACLRKSNDIRLSSRDRNHYPLKDYLRYIKYLEADSQFEKARSEQAVLESNLPELFNGNNITTPQIKSIATDLIYFSGSRLCPLCSIYNRRIFSKSGKDKRFPPLSMLPSSLQAINCPECGVFLGHSAYYALNVDGELIRDIKESNRTFVDIRTAEQKKLYEEEKQKKLLKIQNKAEYTWICENLPDLAPKSLSGYSRMKNSNSANYQKILSLMKEKGFVLE